MTTFSVSCRGWTRVLALLLSALLALGVTGGLAASASAQGATAAKAQAKGKAKAKKKTQAKKCKKGYTKVGKQCKKKQPPAKTSTTVESVKLTRFEQRVYGIKLLGTLTLKKPVNSIKAIVVRSRDGRDTTREDTIESDGTSLTVDFEVIARRPLTRERSRTPITYWVVVDGVKSNVLR